MRLAKERFMLLHSSSPSVTSALRKPVCARVLKSAKHEAPKAVFHVQLVPLQRTLARVSASSAVAASVARAALVELLGS